MLLAITAEGFGGKWGTGGLTRDPETYDVLGIDPDKESIEGFVWLGTPKIVPSITRPELVDVLRQLD